VRSKKIVKIKEEEMSINKPLKGHNKKGTFQTI